MRKKIKQSIFIGIVVAIIYLLPTIILYAKFGFDSHSQTPLALLVSIGWAGLIAVIIAYCYFKFNSKIFAVAPEKNGLTEPIILYSAATLSKGIYSAATGILYLSNNTIFFISNRFSAVNTQHQIPINTIVSAKRYKNYGLINNGLKITTNNSVFNFLIFNAEEWLLKINATLKTNEVAV